MTVETLRFLVLREGDMLVAQGLELDLCTQAKNHEELRRRIDDLIEMERACGLEVSGTEFGHLDPAPEEFHKMWDESLAFQNQGLPYEMALAS